MPAVASPCRVMTRVRPEPAPSTGWPVDWRIRAACRDMGPDGFFTPDGRAGKAEEKTRVDRARQVCAGCPVRRWCLALALYRREEHGVWGGLTEGERKGHAPPTPADAVALADRLIG